MDNNNTKNNTTKPNTENAEVTPIPLQNSILIERVPGAGGLKLDFKVLLSYTLQMRNVSEKEKDMFLKFVSESFSENLVVIKKDTIAKNGILDNSVQFAIKCNLDEMTANKEKIEKINTDFINHYAKDEKGIPRVKLGMSILIDANQLLKTEDYYFNGIMIFGDLLNISNTPKKATEAKEAYDKATSNEWRNIIFINQRYKEKFPDYENIRKVFANSRFTKIILLDENNPSNNIVEVKVEFYKNVNYIHYDSTIIEAQGENFYSTYFHKGFINVTRNIKKEITKINNRHSKIRDYLAFQSLNLILKNVSTSWVAERFVKIENKIFNSDLKLCDKILKRTMLVDEEFLNSIDKKKGKKFGKKGGNKNNQNRNEPQNQTYRPFADAFNDEPADEQAVEEVEKMDIAAPEPSPDPEAEVKTEAMEAVEPEGDMRGPDPDEAAAEAIPINNIPPVD